MLNYWLLAIYLSYLSNNQSFSTLSNRMLLKSPSAWDCIISECEGKCDDCIKHFAESNTVQRKNPEMEMLISSVRPLASTKGRGKGGLHVENLQALVHKQGMVYGPLDPWDTEDKVKYLTQCSKHFISKIMAVLLGDWEHCTLNSL